MQPKCLLASRLMTQAPFLPCISDRELRVANWNMLHDVNAVTLEGCQRTGMVREQPDAPQIQVTENLCAHPNIALDSAIAVKLRNIFRIRMQNQRVPFDR